MTIKDVNGEQLSLTKTTLEEVTGFVATPFYINLKEWINSPDTFLIRAVDKTNAFHPGHEGGFSIGCRHFSKKVYSQIVRAAKLVAGKKPVRKTNKVARKKGKKS